MPTKHKYIVFFYSTVYLKKNYPHLINKPEKIYVVLVQDPHLQYGLPPMPVSGMRKTSEGPGMDRGMDRGMDMMDGHSSDEDSQVKHHRRRISTEEKAKVVAAVWGTEFNQFLAELAILYYEDLKNRMNCTRLIGRKG